jgi:uncharacterized protein (DUF1778 family)
MADNKTDQLRVRLGKPELAAFEEAARLSGLSLSAWVRTACREAAEARLAKAGQKAGWVK